MSHGSEQKKEKKSRKVNFGSKALRNLFIMRSGWCCVPCERVSQTERPESSLARVRAKLLRPSGGCMLLQLSGSNSETPPRTKKQPYLKVVVMTMSTCDRLPPSTPSTPSHPCLVVSRSKRQGGKPHCYTDWGLGWGLSNSMWHENTWKILHHDATCCMLQ